MKNVNQHYLVVLTMILWIKENQTANIEPTYQGYLADTALAGAETTREAIFDFLKDQIENPRPWDVDEPQRVYSTSEKEFLEGFPVWEYPEYKVFQVGQNIILTNKENVEMNTVTLSEAFGTNLALSAEEVVVI